MPVTDEASRGALNEIDEPAQRHLDSIALTGFALHPFDRRLADPEASLCAPTLSAILSVMPLLPNVIVTSPSSVLTFIAYLPPVVRALDRLVPRRSIDSSTGPLDAQPGP